VTVRGRDLESLLVAWLNELIFRADAHKRVYPVVDLNALSDHELTAALYGATPAASRTAVKAATLHRLRVGERRGGGYEARVVLDV